ncbi:MAG: hypothetical protein HY049_08490 [Acidobacteria bacterium]|nr:hypothetical protein [Acidobacteriota bacterium]
MPRLARGAALLLAMALSLAPLRAEGTLTGWVEAKADAYRDSGSPDAVGWMTSRLAWERRLTPHLLVRASGDFDLDTHNEVDRRSFYDSSDRALSRAPARIEDLSATWTMPAWDLAAGKMILPWGRADVWNPTDNLTPFDTLDPLDRVRLSSWAIRGRLYRGATTVEGDVLPAPGVTRLPIADRRWLPLPASTPSPFPGGPSTLALDWREGDATYPGVRLDNAAWAVKVDRRGSWCEGSISHYQGWDDQSVLLGRPLLGPSTPTTLVVALDRVQPRLRSTGGDLAIVRGRLALRGELAVDSRGAPADRSFTFFVLEAEWTQGNWRMIGGWADIRGAAAVTTTASSLEQGALPAVILHVERSVPTGPGASIEVVRSLQGDGTLGRGEVSLPVGPSLRISAGVEMIDGPDGTFLGAWRRNDRALVRARWSFRR